MTIDSLRLSLIFVRNRKQNKISDEDAMRITGMRVDGGGVPVTAIPAKSGNNPERRPRLPKARAVMRRNDNGTA
ncbi:hypothetical protein GCM10007913_23970 [Devosia yakushimensis]|uniref:Uncharacterized protein n=1 Tax=Devosia yakushimensis TaxID=470028 RepID=A0ABQ5UGX8_9HYPH|nr:hypothetical protein GCM10007913_23970 [Devosia yakushimensis]